MKEPIRSFDGVYEFMSPHYKHSHAVTGSYVDGKQFIVEFYANMLKESKGVDEYSAYMKAYTRFFPHGVRGMNKPQRSMLLLSTIDREIATPNQVINDVLTAIRMLLWFDVEVSMRKNPSFEDSFVFENYSTCGFLKSNVAEYYEYVFRRHIENCKAKREQDV
tara:strand:- start:824 stop:1312 length:489 start_codon:yes stop_codon:yes gene_type:complete